MSAGGVFANTKEALLPVDQSEKIAKDKVFYEQQAQKNIERLKQSIMDACQRNIDAVMVLTKRSDLNSEFNSRINMLGDLLNKTQNLLHFQAKN